MAILAYELPETYASITRPVAQDVIKQLMVNLKINEAKVPIYFPGANGKVTVWNANNVQSQDSASFNARERILINVKEDYIEDDILTLVSKRREYPAIFMDNQAGITVSPIYSRTKVTVSINYRTSDRWQAESFRDNMRRKIAENREYMTFNARYKYPIPEVITKAFYLLFLTRKETMDDFDYWRDYFFAKGSRHLTVLTNAAGEGDTIAMVELQEDILGGFQDSLPPELEKDELGAVWNINFEFEYHYDKPISIELHYPLLINNHLIHEVLYPEVKFNPRSILSSASRTRNYYTGVQEEMNFYWVPHEAVLRIPEFDDWAAYSKADIYRPILSAMIMVDKNNPREICNLTDMGTYGLHESLREAFEKNANRLTKRGKFPFFIGLYSNDAPMEEDDLRIDEYLNVYASRDMSMFKMYHMVIFILEDLNRMDLESKRNFLKYSQLVNAWLDIILGKRPEGGYPKLNGLGHVDANDLERVIKLNRIGWEGTSHNLRLLNPGHIWATVGVFSIHTHRQNELGGN